MSNPFFARQTQRSRLLQVAEYTSTATAVVGVIVSALSQQVMYAAAPLSLSLCLSLINRRRFEQQTEQRFHGAIAQVNQRLLHLDQGISGQSAQNLAELVTDLSKQLATLQQRHSETAIDLSELRSLLFQLQERNVSATNLDKLQAQLSQVIAQVAAIQQHQAEVVAKQMGLDAQLSQVRESLSQEILVIHQKFQAAASDPSGLETLQQRFPRLTEQISQLQERLLRIEARLPTIESPSISVEPESRELPPELEPKVEPPLILPLLELEDLVLNLGIDFGTSFTKVCFRDIARDRSEIVTFTDEITHLEEALLPTKIGILSNGRLISGLTTSEWERYENQVETTVEFIKMRLAELDFHECNKSWRLEEIPELDDPETVENLCAHYLSRVIVRAQTWIRQNKPELVINQKIEWSANVGVPVEYCDSPAIQRFRNVLSLAWLLSNEPQTEWMTIQKLRDRMKPMRAILEKTAIDCHAIPEIAAEVWSLLNSREVDEGFYILFDVGDGTLDGSSFRYWNDDGEKKVDFYFGKVDPLGVTAFSQRLSQELGISETDVKRTVCGNLTHYPSDFQTSTTRKAIQNLVAQVVVNGSKRHGEHGFRLTWHGFQKPLEILIGGGGGQTSFYTQAITSTHEDRQQRNAGIPEYRVRSLPTPKDLETNGIRSHDFHRFAVAYGLSIPDGDQPEIRLPSEMESIKPQPFKQDDSGQLSSYEDMRGSF
jgi:regulator of replication initiation timing